MAHLRIPDEGREMRDPGEIAAYLEPCGIFYESWKVAGRIGAGAPAEEILDAYAPEIERLKAAGGYVTADVIDVTPQTPGLDEMCAKFSKEHTHAEDEVRFIVAGRGIFHVRPESGPVFALTVEAGDLINVPAGTRHWFDLCEDRRIRAIRLFRDPAGWAPLYVENGVHDRYAPLCFGPSYIPPTSIL